MKLQVFADQGDFSEPGDDGPAECQGADEGEGELRYCGEGDWEEEVLDPKHKNIMDEVDPIGVGAEGFPDRPRRGFSEYPVES